MRLDYSKILRDRAREAATHEPEQKALTVVEYRNKLNTSRWRQRFAREHTADLLPRGPDAVSSVHRASFCNVDFARDLPEAIAREDLQESARDRAIRMRAESSPGTYTHALWNAECRRYGV